MVVRRPLPVTTVGVHVALGVRKQVSHAAQRPAPRLPELREGEPDEQERAGGSDLEVAGPELGLVVVEPPSVAERGLPHVPVVFRVAQLVSVHPRLPADDDT